MSTPYREYTIKHANRRAQCYTLSEGDIAVFFAWRKAGGKNFVAVTNKLYLSWDEAVREADAWVMAGDAK